MITVSIFLLSITDFISHLHPVLVHLPIGILLIAVLFQFLSAKEKFQSLHTAISIALFWGMLSAIASCISGFLLSQSGDYDEDLVSKHQWLGIATAAVSVVAWFLNKKNNKQIKWAMGLMALLIIITGHLGGSLTHGSDYLTKAFSSDNESKSETKRKPIANVQEAVVYTDIIKPVLEAKCYNCHGPNKQKGKLRLDEPDFILKGGKDGKVIVPGKTEESNLIERIFLPEDNEDHMPPKKKKQLSKQEIDLLHWWVSTGAGFNRKTKELSQTEKIKPALLALQSGENKQETIISTTPDKPVEKATDSIIKKLMDRGVAIATVSKNSNYLSANFISVDSITDNDLQLLLPLQKQLIWLNMGYSKIADVHLSTIAKLSSLTRLHLERTRITDNGLEYFKNLSQLQYINVSGTKVTTKGLEQLSGLKQLQQIYLYQTGITGKEWSNLKKIFPNTIIDTGGYKVLLLKNDTVELTTPMKK